MRKCFTGAPAVSSHSHLHFTSDSSLQIESVSGIKTSTLLLPHWEISKGRLKRGDSALFTQAKVIIWHSTGLTSLTLSEDVSSESSSERILHWRVSLRGETDRLGPINDEETFGTRVGFGTTSKNSNLDFCWFWNLWRKLQGGPAVLPSLCHPVLPLHPYTTRSTWQLRPAGTSAPVARGNSAQPVHWGLAASLVQTLTHMVRLPEYVLHQAVEPRKPPLYQNSVLKRKENWFGGIFFSFASLGRSKLGSPSSWQCHFAVCQLFGIIFRLNVTLDFKICRWQR